ncbi:DnaJ domain-containing protein [Salinibacterium sp. SYSU T00001]|uniref:DnaJ C-terminal domain-containing protein n=1 Tax=Homoserinimonas sedimenticola TaxID=2986805 RepID=UPI00223555C8|nr:DnaJ C-terminal domain-containing protein [Salinibacterium sedimenticola]MCW4385608.1 DnaJ domain-containing protein [Salinibacterium sedimenticola]
MASQDWLEKDFYKVLGVSKDVSDAELKKTYRKLARQYHPDSNPGDAKAEARFKEISEANAVLSDPETRREYDQVRAMGMGAPRFTAGGQGQAGGFEDIFGGMFTGAGAPGGARGGYQSADFGDLFGGLFGGGAPAGGFGGGGFRGGPSKGRDVTATTTLDFESAINGDTVRLQGVGGKPMTVRIPAGVSDGQKIRLKGKGEPSPDGGPAGDLTLTVTVKKHPVFTREGNNLRVDVPVTFIEAVEGATIEVPTLGGEPVKLRVAPGTPSGRVLRVKGRGVTAGGASGDLLATVQVVVPGRLTPDAAKAVKALAKALPDENPRDELLAKARKA